MAKLSERDQERLKPFVTEMIKQREHRGWSQADLAKASTYSKSLIASVETYERAPTDPLAKALDKGFDLPGTFERLYDLVRGSAFPAAFGEFAQYEALAVTLMVFELAYAPGLLQTENYARAVLSHHHTVTEEQVTERVRARLDRQQVLTREDPAPPVCWFLVDESMLTREIGSAEVMAEQLDRMIEAGSQPGVSVQVVPRSTGAHPGLAGTFYIAELRDGTTIVFCEDIKDGSITDDPATVAEVMQRWRYITSLALPQAASLELIQEMRDAWKATSSQARGAKQLTAVPTAADA